jgi:hypothetical protein
MAEWDMVADPDVPKPPEPANVDHLVFWDPCSGAAPIVVQDPRAFVMGRIIVLAIALGLLGLLGLVVALVQERS